MDDHSFPGSEDFPDHDPHDSGDSFDSHDTFGSPDSFGAHDSFAGHEPPDAEDQPAWADSEDLSGIDVGHDAPWSEHDHADAPDLYSDGHDDLPQGDHAEPDAAAAHEDVHHDDLRHEPGAAEPEPPLGADPDLPPTDDGAHEWLDLPDLNHVDVPEPLGGAPWVDTSLLGSHDVSALTDPAAAHPSGAMDDLRAALGEPAGAGAPGPDELLTSDDPAVRALAHLWGPSPR